jgi:hypothetical protein
MEVIMTSIIKHPIRTLLASVVVAGAIVPLAGTASADHMKGGASVKVAVSAVTSVTKAASLRVTLNRLLTEHVVLASAATNAALGGRSTEFRAAAAALDANSVDIANAIGSIYGESAGRAFLPLWRKHIGFFVQYTTGKAKRDARMVEKARRGLIDYTRDFAAFINSASPALPAEAVAKLSRAHVKSFFAVIDAQAAGKQTEAFFRLRKAMAHMKMIANPLAETIVQQFAAKFQ